MKLYAIDNNNTVERDDAFNVMINENIITIEIAFPYMLDIDKDVLSIARFNNISKYSSNEYMFNKKIIEQKTLKDGDNKVFLLKIVLNANTYELNSYFSIENREIKCFNFDNYNEILESELNDIKTVSEILNKRRLNQNKLIFTRPSIYIKDDATLDYTKVKSIVASYNTLANEIAAKHLKQLKIDGTKILTKKDPLMLRGENKTYYEKNVTKKQAKDYSENELLIANLFLSSTRFDDNTKFHNYTYVTSPLRRYVDIIVQDLIINNNTNYSLPNHNFEEYMYNFQKSEMREKKNNSIYNDLKKYNYYRYKVIPAYFVFKRKDNKYYKLDTGDLIVSKDKYFNNETFLQACYYNEQLIFTSKIT